ncbi:MAG: sporulation protein YqfD [Lachnospiraceae bacterium]|nr:sporulation protein YqfD [Lachnospiraceae bacterium]
MVGILLRWLNGYLILNISGNSKERFMKLCELNDILLWKIKKIENNIRFRVSKRDYKKVLGYVKKTDCTVSIEDKRGLPFFMYKYKKRKCFIIGIVIFIILLLYSNNFIWKINILGSSIYTDNQILTYVKEELIKPGTKIDDVDCYNIEKILREKYSKIAWISCYIKGTEFNIEISDTIEPDKIETGNSPCDIVAVKDCIIIDMIAKTGVPAVTTGMSIKKGDVLISGAVEIYNDYDELTEINFVVADGYVYGETIYTYYDTFSARHYEKEYTGNEIKLYSLIFGDKICSPYVPEIKYDYYDVINEEKNLKINNTYTAPLSFYLTTVKEYKPVACVYTQEEGFEKAEKKLNLYIDDLKKKGVEILENNVKIEVVDDTFVSSGTIVVKELIGIPRDIDVSNYNLDKLSTDSTKIQGE